MGGLIKKTNNGRSRDVKGLVTQWYCLFSILLKCFFFYNYLTHHLLKSMNFVYNLRVRIQKSSKCNIWVLLTSFIRGRT